VDILIAKGLRIKHKYSQVVAQAHSFKQMLEQDSEWGWLHKENLVDLLECEEMLATRMTSFTHYVFSGVTPNEIKKAHCEKELPTPTWATMLLIKCRFAWHA
jgi:hypothetical protein